MNTLVLRVVCAITAASGADAARSLFRYGRWQTLLVAPRLRLASRPGELLKCRYRALPLPRLCWSASVVEYGMARWPLAAAGVAAFAWGRESSRDECPPTSFGCTGRTGQSNTFRRGFFGHVVPGGDGGSVISGTLRLHRAAAIFATEWVLGVAVFCLIIVGRLAVALVRSETAAIHGLLVAFGLLLLFVAAAVSMFELVFRKAQPDEAFLISWLQNKAKEIDSPPQSR